MRFILTLCAAALLVPTLVSGQAAPLVPDWPIAPGSRVRILSPVFGNRHAAGSVVSSTPDTLVFRAARESTSTVILTPNIVRIDVARGTHNNKGRYGFAGFLVGAIVGAAIGAATNPPPCTNCLDFSQGTAALTLGLLGGLGGAFIGTALGRRETDTWVPVAVPAR